MKTSAASSPAPSAPAAPALRISHAARRKAARAHEVAPVNQIGRFDPRKYALRPKAQRAAAARAYAAGAAPKQAQSETARLYTTQGDAARADAAAMQAARPRSKARAGGTPSAPPLLTPTINPPPLRPLVLARPQVREGGEDYKQHPSRLTPQLREDYWARDGGNHPAPAPRRK